MKKEMLKIKLSREIIYVFMKVMTKILLIATPLSLIYFSLYVLINTFL
jgi:hypothetical protein